MSRYVANLGGAFLYSTEPANLAAWYEKTLDIKYDHPNDSEFYFTLFKYHPLDLPNKQTCAVLSIFKAEQASEVKTARFNYRVYDIEEVVKHIKALETEVTAIEECPEGKFAWLHDPDGNQVELWQDTNLG